MPDKSVSLLDTACARVALSQSATPPAVEDGRRQIDQMTVSIGILEREMANGAQHETRIAELSRGDKSRLESVLAQLEERWKREKDRGEDSLLSGSSTESGQEAASQPVNAGHRVNRKPRTGAARRRSPAAAPVVPTGDERKAAGRFAGGRSRAADGSGRNAARARLRQSAGHRRKVASWTGIPVGRMVADEIKTVLHLKDLLEQSVVGQSHALDVIAQRIRTSRANLTDPRRPIGVFLLVGTSGVGKTETAITLADLLYGGEQNMTVINMSEFKEEHKVSLLMGSPPATSATAKAAC